MDSKHLGRYTGIVNDARIPDVIGIFGLSALSLGIAAFVAIGDAIAALRGNLHESTCQPSRAAIWY